MALAYSYLEAFCLNTFSKVYDIFLIRTSYRAISNRTARLLHDLNELHKSKLKSLCGRRLNSEYGKRLNNDCDKRLNNDCDIWLNNGCDRNFES